MAFVDRNNSRERAMSGVASVLVVGGVGYAMVAGLAMTVVPQISWIIPARTYPAPVEPKPPAPHPKTSKQPKIETSAKTMLPLVDPKIMPIDPGPKIDIGTSTIPTDPGSATGTPPQTGSTGTIDKSAGVQPKGNGQWVTPDDYPLSAERAGVQGRTVFQLDIGANGRVTECVVTKSSGSDELDRTACRLIKARASFRPALDADGNAANGHYTGGVSWTIPSD